MIDKDESTAAVWLAAVLHEVLQPIGAAQLEAELATEHLGRASKSLRRSVLGLQALRWLARVLMNDEIALAERLPCAVAVAVASAKPPGADLIADVPSYLAVLSAPGTLEIFLSNLIANAREHAQGAPIVISARSMDRTEAGLPADTAACLGSRLVCLTVADDGPGIADPGRLFEPFGTSCIGRGIGLWLCRRLVRAHGGDLWLDEAERGTCFTSVWPYALPLHPEGWPSESSELGKAIRAARTAAGMTRAQLAAIAGVSDSTIRNIEMGCHKSTPATLAALTDALANGQGEARWLNPRRKNRRPR